MILLLTQLQLYRHVNQSVKYPVNDKAFFPLIEENWCVIKQQFVMCIIDIHWHSSEVKHFSAFLLYNTEHWMTKYTRGCEYTWWCHVKMLSGHHNLWYVRFMVQIYCDNHWINYLIWYACYWHMSSDNSSSYQNSMYIITSVIKSVTRIIISTTDVCVFSLINMLSPRMWCTRTSCHIIIRHIFYTLDTI